MEVALHHAYSKIALVDERPHYKMVHEYPLEGNPPMMTHIFENDLDKRIIAAKGAPEALMNVSSLPANEKQQIENAIRTLATDDYRVLGVGEANIIGNNYPVTQQEFQFNFKGIVAFCDPPKKNIQSALKIYTNLKKAIQYIISIHIPIILTVFIPLALGWIYPNILYRNRFLIRNMVRSNKMEEENKSHGLLNMKTANMGGRCTTPFKNNY